jgi:hypothetical protein
VVGRPFEIVVTWPCSQDPDEDNDTSCDRPFVVTSRCEAGRCVIVQRAYAGEVTLEVTPLAAGRLTVAVTLSDGLIDDRTQRFGPIQVLAPDRIEIACSSRLPAGGPREPCGDEVVSSRDVQLEITVHSGPRRLTTAVPTIRINDREHPLGSGIAYSPWVCIRSIDPGDRRGTTIKCVGHDISEGRYVVVASIGAVSERLDVVVVMPGI